MAVSTRPSLLLILLAGLSAQLLAGEKPQYREGVHYKRIVPAQTTQAGLDQVEVVEMFLYGCPHCYELEPKLKSWLDRQSNISFRRIPAIAAPGWVEMARFYYTAEKLGVLDQLHEKFYASIHKDGRQYYNPLALERFFAVHGISSADFQQAYHSEEVRERMGQARQATLAYQVRGVPMVVVGGEYLAAPFLVKDQEEMLQVLDYLLARIKAEKAAKPRLTTGFQQEFNRTTALNQGKARSGQEVYEFRCAGCHGKNTQGAPMPGDREEWQRRLKKGKNVLLEHAVNGYGVYMPPRGGCRDCREEELSAAIDYMLEQKEIRLWQGTSQ